MVVAERSSRLADRAAGAIISGRDRQAVPPQIKKVDERTPSTASACQWPDRERCARGPRQRAWSESNRAGLYPHVLLASDQSAASSEPGTCSRGIAAIGGTVILFESHRRITLS